MLCVIWASEKSEEIELFTFSETLTYLDHYKVLSMLASLDSRPGISSFMPFYALILSRGVLVNRCVLSRRMQQRIKLAEPFQLNFKIAPLFIKNINYLAFFSFNRSDL